MKAFTKAVFISLSGVIFASSAVAQNVAPFPSFADLAEKLLPSVVNISTVHDPEQVEAEDALETNVETIFNKEKSNRVSLGSGFIIDEDGYIITNNHVIDKAKAITVSLADNSQTEAVLIGKDPKTDIALIKIDADKKLQPVVFGNSDKMRIGDWILAIGNPFGLGGSVTAGIVSAKSRDIETGPYDSYIQTDASINQGSSGGPMFNLSGEVIGVNTAIFSTNGGNMGVGFAIPVNMINFVIKELKNTGNVKRGWIGVKMQPNTVDIANSVNQDAADGILISSVNENSSADKAGIKAGDIVLAFEGKKIDSTQNLSRMVAETPIGKKADFTIWRDGQQFMLNAVIEEMPETSESSSASDIAPTTAETEKNNINEFGFSVENIDAEAINKYNLSENVSGVIITEVLAGSDALEKGLKAGDVITQIDKKSVLDVNDALLYINEAKRENKRPVLLQIKDNDVFHFVAVKPYKNDKN